MVRRIRRQLHSGTRTEYNRLQAGIGTVDTTVTLDFALANNVVVGAVLNVELELMRVVAVDTTTKIVTVVRGWLDSDPQIHAAGAEVVINPRFSLVDVYDAMIEEIGSWGPQLYRPVGFEVTIAYDATVYELPAQYASCFGVIDVRMKIDSDIVGDAWPEQRYRLQRGTTGWTSGAPNSGLLLRFPDYVTAGPLFITVAMPYVAGEPALADDLTAAPLSIPMSMLDVLAMGTKLRVAQDSEWARTSRAAQDDTRRAEEMQPGQGIQPLQFGVAIYRNRKQEEVNKLRAQFPIRAM
jgi:hypothetical protein